MPRIPNSTKCILQTADRIQNVDCRMQSGYKMQIENQQSFSVWYLITCHLTACRASPNRFSAISFHDYLHYRGIFLARFKIKIDLNIISSLHIVFSLCARVSWCDVYIDFTNVIKVDVDVKRDVTIEYLTRAIFEKQSTALQVVRIIIFLSGMCLFCWQQCGPRPKLFHRLDIISTLVDHITNVNLPP